ncbi:hypothetical protein POM88_016488 [Heracleum sosnowskyi]|uniref:Uncharacterized protein n=1 Tax=Heracleum sosnowskyi TaxID=360622 RepID=A0AAD8IM98_9APIA|nr:hypothetical protein POM88_016488 [Heracleum sosnowskyi]
MAEEESCELSKQTMTETVSEKLLPAYNAVSNATYAITFEISSLTVETLGSTDKTSNSSSGSRGQIQNSAIKAAESSGETGVSTDQKSSSNKPFTASKSFTTKHDPSN